MYMSYMYSAARHMHKRGSIMTRTPAGLPVRAVSTIFRDFFYITIRDSQSVTGLGAGRLVQAGSRRALLPCAPKT